MFLVTEFELLGNPVCRLWSIEFWLDASKRKTDTRTKRTDRAQPFYNILHSHTHTQCDRRLFNLCFTWQNWKTRSANWVSAFFVREERENVYVNFGMQRIEKVFHARHVTHSPLPLPPLSLSNLYTQVFPVCEKHKIEENCSGQGENAAEVAFQVLPLTHSTIIAGNGSAKCCHPLPLALSSTPSSLSTVVAAVWTATASKIAAKWFSLMSIAWYSVCPVNTLWI